IGNVFVGPSVTTEYPSSASRCPLPRLAGDELKSLHDSPRVLGLRFTVGAIEGRPITVVVRATARALNAYPHAVYRRNGRRIHRPLPLASAKHSLHQSDFPCDPFLILYWKCSSDFIVQHLGHLILYVN